MFSDQDRQLVDLTKQTEQEPNILEGLKDVNVSPAISESSRTSNIDSLEGSSGADEDESSNSLASPNASTAISLSSSPLRASAQISYIETSSNTRQKLISYGVLRQECKNQGSAFVPGVDLDMVCPNIHLIFRQENWCPSEISGDQWQCLVPAFVLASKFISRDATDLFDFFVRVDGAELEEGMSRLNVSKASSLPPSYIFNNKESPSGVQRRKVTAFFADMAPFVRFSAAQSRFEGYNQRFENGLPDAECGLEDYTPPFGSDVPAPPGATSIISIVINPSYLVAIDAARHDNDRYRRISFDLAMLLLHEICHAFWFFKLSDSCRADEQRCLEITKMPEPRYQPFADLCGRYSSDGDELGRLWEFLVLGFHPYSSQSIEVGNGGRIVDVLMPEGLVGAWDRQFGDRDLLLSMEYIDQWWRAETWRNIKLHGMKGARRPVYVAEFELRLKEGWDTVWCLVVEERPIVSKHAFEADDPEAELNLPSGN